LLRVRRVESAEADDICASLANLHHDALRSGMALGALDSMSRGVLERSYRDVVASLDQRERVVLVAEEEGAGILGMAQLVFSGVTNADHRAEVQRVAVDSGARGRGVGRRLMAAIEHAAGEDGVTLLWLTTHDGTDACAFYEAIGYTKLGVMPDYSRRPDGTLWPGAFYFKKLPA
jgi:ribosomal protein S18 acetylase RimI-like enzyme